MYNRRRRESGSTKEASRMSRVEREEAHSGERVADVLRSLT